MDDHDASRSLTSDAASVSFVGSPQLTRELSKDSGHGPGGPKPTEPEKRPPHLPMREPPPPRQQPQKPDPGSAFPQPGEVEQQEEKDDPGRAWVPGETTDRI